MSYTLITEIEELSNQQEDNNVPTNPNNHSRPDSSFQQQSNESFYRTKSVQKKTKIPSLFEKTPIQQVMINNSSDDNNNNKIRDELVRKIEHISLLIADKVIKHSDYLEILRKKTENIELMMKGILLLLFVILVVVLVKKN